MTFMKIVLQIVTLLAVLPAINAFAVFLGITVGLSLVPFAEARTARLPGTPLFRPESEWPQGREHRKARRALRRAKRRPTLANMVIPATMPKRWVALPTGVGFLTMAVAVPFRLDSADITLFELSIGGYPATVVSVPLSPARQAVAL